MTLNPKDVINGYDKPDNSEAETENIYKLRLMVHEIDESIDSPFWEGC